MGRCSLTTSASDKERQERYAWEDQDSLEVKEVGKGKSINLEEIAAWKAKKQGKKS